MAFEWLEFVEPCSGTPYAVSLHSHQAVWGSPPAMLQEGFSQKFDPIGKTWLYSGTSVSNSKSAPLRPFPLRPGQLDKKPSTTAASTFAPISASSSDNGLFYLFLFFLLLSFPLSLL
ncbi:MAG: hypothetical protein Q8P67_16210 [archaeon]|nr:hypothetical protein [archaeon]